MKAGKFTGAIREMLAFLLVLLKINPTI